MRLETSALLAVLLASTGLTQAEAAALVQVDGRTVRRWIEGTRPTPKVAIERLRAWVYALNQTALSYLGNASPPGSRLKFAAESRATGNPVQWIRIPIVL